MTESVDADGALRRLREALVLSYAYDAGARTFELITDYPDRAPDAARSFVALRFTGVDRFYREPGTLVELQLFGSRYELVDDARPIVIQGLRTAPAGAARTLELDLGPSFGALSFRFTAVTAAVRHAAAEARDGTWIYRDARSGEPFDYTRPFAGT